MPAPDLPREQSSHVAIPPQRMPAPHLPIPPRPPLPAPESPAAARSNTDRAAGLHPLLRNPRTYLVAYAVALATIAFWPSPVDRDTGPLLRLLTRLVPVLTYPRIEFLANVVLFVPLGLLLTLILIRSRWLVLPIVFLATVTIECVQAVLLDARTPSALDIVANTAGGCLGILVALLFERLRARRTRRDA